MDSPRWPQAASAATVRGEAHTVEIKSGANPNLFKHFGDRAVCGDDKEVVGRGKPSPDIFLVAAHTGLGLQHTEEGRSFLKGVRLPGAEHDGTLQGSEHEVLVFEDALPGVQAGLAAGMRGTYGYSNMSSGLGPRSQRTYKGVCSRSCARSRTKAHLSVRTRSWTPLNHSSQSCGVCRPSTPKPHGPCPLALLAAARWEARRQIRSATGPPLRAAGRKVPRAPALRVPLR